MYRFFCSSSQISVDKINIKDKEQVHHIKNVLRLQKGKQVIVLDDKGNEYIAEIEKFLLDRAVLMIKDRHSVITDKKFQLTIACAIPKKSRMDDIIDKLTQLGVERIIPLRTERVVIKLDKHKEVLRQQHWKKVALNAAQQSQRSTLPIIEQIKDLQEILLRSEDFDLKLIPTLAGERKALRDVFVGSRPKHVLVLIGPEGDFTEEEIALAKKSGCIPVSLGESILRVETAAVAVASFIRLYADN